MPTYIQSKKLNSSGTSVTLAFNSNTGTGHALVVAGRIGATTPTAGCSDSQGNTYVHAASTYNASGPFQTDIFVTANSSAAADSVTYTSSVSGAIELAIHEYSGLLTSNTTILDALGNASATDPGGSGNTTPSTASVTPANPICLLFGAIATNTGSATFTAGQMGTGVTANVRQNVASKLITEDNIAFATNPYEANGSLSVSDNWNANLVALVAPLGYLSPIGVEAQFFSNTGVMLAGGKINTYRAGTTTPTSTYTDYTLSTANANPIILSSYGRLPGGVWQVAGVPIKVVITDSSNNVQITIDNISGIDDPSAAGAQGVGGILSPQTAAEIAASVAPTNYGYEPWRGEDIRRFGANGNGVADNSAVLTSANSIGSALYIPPGVYVVASNITLTVPLFFDSRATLKPSSGNTITINAAINAGLWQIFDTSAGGSIAGKIRMSPGLYPEHFGATGNTKRGQTGMVTTGSATFTDSNANFLATDMNKTIVIAPPPYTSILPLVTTITGYTSGTQVTLGANAAFSSTASFTGSIGGASFNVLTVSGTVTGTLFDGQSVSGAGITHPTAIAYQISGTTGGAGTYQLTVAQTGSISAEAMTSSYGLVYYYGTDDTTAINAANATAGALGVSLGSASNHNTYSFTTTLHFNAPCIYLMTQQAVIGGAANTTAMSWEGVGGKATIVLALGSSTTNAVSFGAAGATSGSSIKNLIIDACFTGQDLFQYGGYESTQLKNVEFRNAQRDGISVTPQLGSFLQQCDCQDVTVQYAGRHGLYVYPETSGIAAQMISNSGSGYSNGPYSNVPLTGGHGYGATANITVIGAQVTALVIVNPGNYYQIGDSLTANLGSYSMAFSASVTGLSNSFANEFNWLNLVIGDVSVRQPNAVAIYFDQANNNSPDSWMFRNWKITQEWQGDPNYQPANQAIYVNTGATIFGGAGCSFYNGYIEQSGPAIGVNAPPWRVTNGATAVLTFDNFYCVNWGADISRGKHDGASQFTVTASSSQDIMVVPGGSWWSGDIMVYCNDGTHYSRRQFSVMAVGASTTGGATIQQLNPATYTQSIAGGALEVDPGGAVSFTVSSSLDVGTGNVHITVNNTSGSLGMTLQYSGLTKQRSGVVGWVF